MKAKKQIPKREPNIRNVKAVEDLKNLIENKKTILIASIKNLPASQFQEICKKLREKAIVKFPKKNLIIRALDSSGKEAIKNLKEKVGESVAVLFSDLDVFELAGELLASKSLAKAKAGQEATEDVEVQAGPTDLLPGPAISDLGAVGIDIQIEKGKITIRNPKVIVKKGEKVSSAAAEVMNKLDIKPFSVGFTPLCAFDNQEGKFYSELKIDKEGTLKELKVAFGKALPFAVEINYSNEETIKFLIGKVGSHEKVISDKVNSAGDVVDNKKEEDNQDNQKNNKQLTENTPEEAGGTPLQNPEENKSEGEENK
jgi:large subunit ribosomal protein L10